MHSTAQRRSLSTPPPDFDLDCSSIIVPNLLLQRNSSNMERTESPESLSSASSSKSTEDEKDSYSDGVECLGVTWSPGTREQEKNDGGGQRSHSSTTNPTIPKPQDPVHHLEQHPHGRYPPGYPYAVPPPANAFHHPQFGHPMGPVPPHDAHRMAMYQNQSHQPHHHGPANANHPVPAHHLATHGPPPHAVHPAFGMQPGQPSNNPPTRQPQGSVQPAKPPVRAQLRPPKKPPAPPATKILEASNKTQEIQVERIECPHPKDVLFPISGFQLWAGNVRYRRVVNNRRDEFLKSPPDDRLAIAQSVRRGVVKEGGRFLRAIELSPLEKQGEKNPMVICRTNWQEVDEKTALEQITKLFNSYPEAREDSKMRREARCRRRRERRLAAQYEAQSSKQPKDVGLVGGPPPGPLVMLYYKPTKRGFGRASQGRRGSKVKSITELPEFPADEDMSSSDSSAGSVSTLESSPPIPASKPAARKKAAAKKRAAPKGTTPRSPPKKKAAKSAKTPKPPATPPTPHVALHPLGSALDLPKGVTVRPSGKWQAQTYFAGQSRYVGVYDTASMAAVAYNVVVDFVADFKRTTKIRPDATKEELAAIFATARMKADNRVKEIYGPGAVKGIK